MTSELLIALLVCYLLLSPTNKSDIVLLHFRFTKMTLPRSVREMSKLDFLPRHCKSDHFRGFSFIGDSFPLPERSVSASTFVISIYL